MRHGRGGTGTSHEACAGLLKLDVVACRGEVKWEADAGETYRGWTWRGMTPDADARPGLRNQKLDAVWDRTLESTRQRFASEHDETLQVELARLRQWAEDEETALREKQEELRRRIADAKSRSERTAGYVQRFRVNQQAAELKKERRREEERLRLLGVEVRRKRDERITEAENRAKCRFWDEEMFVVRFKVVDTL